MSFAANSVIAKSRAVFGRRLTAEDYAQLAAKETVSQVCDHLKATERYGAVLSAVNSSAVHRGQLEALLGRAVFGVYESFRKFDYSESRGYFNFIVEQLEIRQIISAIGAVYAGAADEYIAAVPMYLNKYSKTDLPALGSAKNLSELAEFFVKTPYEKPLCGVLNEAARTGRLDMGECERGLYTGYYINMLETIEKKFHGKNKKELKRAILRAIDMENVVTLYRMARFSASGEKDIKKLLIPFKYRLRDEVLDELAAEKDISRVAARLEKIGYRCAGDAGSDVELLTERISLAFLEKTIRQSQNAAAVYFVLTESLSIELKNIRTVIEGVRYGLASEEIMKMLVI